ncbi:uncharacterized protein TRAVEDRAFT_22867 [Trametes versicolor FP-101664 SS1]|uniref:uncharacterized protein n=1 Tax=Trametes versicolor (strain FP-101664) TaxID=717944 RepID=UPI0004621885|nr:uncharacterized protein TRAVEDRAFT_22867 [Trametes versicolor FP-101664 SS1]EIW55084.1 hypothetical protein TRAVEDRAFT_22867 [Trametes versicolor FP-101664 SS1]
MPLFGKHNKNNDKHDAKHDARRDAEFNDNQNMGQPGFAGQNQNTMREGQPGFAGQTGAGMNHGMHADPYANQTSAPGTGPSAPVPPASHINADPAHRGGGGGASRLAGKAERAAGAMVGSQALKEKGYQKEQEAGVFKMQSAEIAEAERLEKEALMRRERAVAHGAHPDNRHLGGMQNANTLSDVTGGQAGHPTMGGSAGGAGY